MHNSYSIRYIIRAFFFICLFFSIIPPHNNVVAESGSWTLTDPLYSPTSWHTSTLLPNGKILIAGGQGPSGDTSKSLLFDPSTNHWTKTGSLNSGRRLHAAILLKNGTVLVCGGVGLASAEIYDPVTGIWTPTGAMKQARHFFTATLLRSGKVLVAGGYGNGFLSSAEIYDPTNGSWSFTGSMNTVRYVSKAVLLNDGRVLNTGGDFGFGIGLIHNSAEIYNPASGTWSYTGSMNIVRSGHTLTILNDGRVLAAGHGNSAEIYSPSTGIWTTISPMSTARTHHTATLLSNGKVFIVGGADESGSKFTTEIFDPVSETWDLSGSLNIARNWHTADLLPDSRVVVVGGMSEPNYTSSVEYYEFSAEPPTTVTPTPINTPFPTITPSFLSLPSSGFPAGKTSYTPPQPIEKEYSDLGDFWLEIPKMAISIPIVGIPITDTGWDLTWLGNQAGWMNDTAYPTHSGNSVITGHVVLSNGLTGPFSNLKSLRWDDEIIIHMSDQKYIFQVRSVKIIKPDDLDILEHENLPWITLITCQNYDSESETYLNRVAVKAILIKVQ